MSCAEETHPRHAAPIPSTKPPRSASDEQQLQHFRRNGYEIDVSPLIGSVLQESFQAGPLVQKIYWTLRGYARRTLELTKLHEYYGTSTPPARHAVLLVGCRCSSANSRKMIYDIDDLVFLGKTSQANRITRFLRSPRKYNYLMQSADHVITCTPYLDEYVRKRNRSTTDISSRSTPRPTCRRPPPPIPTITAWCWAGAGASPPPPICACSRTCCASSGAATSSPCA